MPRPPEDPHGQNQVEGFSATSIAADRGETNGGSQDGQQRADAKEARPAIAALRRQPSSGGGFRERVARLRELSRSRHRASHQWHGARARHSLHSAVPAGGGVEAPLSRRRVPDDLRAQRLDQPCQLIFYVFILNTLQEYGLK